MPFSFDGEWKIIIVLVAKNILDIFVANLEREADAFDLISFSGAFIFYICMLRLLGTETALGLADLEMFLIESIFEFKDKLRFYRW